MSADERDEDDDDDDLEEDLQDEDDAEAPENEEELIQQGQGPNQVQNQQGTFGPNAEGLGAALFQADMDGPHEGYNDYLREIHNEGGTGLEADELQNKIDSDQEYGEPTDKKEDYTGEKKFSVTKDDELNLNDKDEDDEENEDDENSDDDSEIDDDENDPDFDDKKKYHPLNKDEEDNEDSEENSDDDEGGQTQQEGQENQRQGQKEGKGGSTAAGGFAALAATGGIEGIIKLLRAAKKSNNPEVKNALQTINKQVLRATVAYVGWNIGIFKPEYWYDTVIALLEVVNAIPGLSAAINLALKLPVVQAALMVAAKALDADASKEKEKK